MPTKLDSCPEKTSLVEFLLGKLPVGEFQTYEEHISKCDACEDTIRGLGTNDTLSEIAGGESFSGSSLLALHNNRLVSREELQDAKHLMRSVLHRVLDHRQLKSRELFSY